MDGNIISFNRLLAPATPNMQKVFASLRALEKIFTQFRRTKLPYYNCRVFVSGKLRNKFIRPRLHGPPVDRPVSPFHIRRLVINL